MNRPLSYNMKNHVNLRLTCHVKDAIAGSDMGQEGVPQPLARMGTLHQARNVHHIKECWDFAANQEERKQRFSSLRKYFETFTT